MTLIFPEGWLERSTESRDDMSLAWYLASVFPGNNFTVEMNPFHVLSHNSGLDPVQIEQEVVEWFKVFRNEDVLAYEPDFGSRFVKYAVAHPEASESELDAYWLWLENN